jgi:DNA modification methylase
MNQQELKVQYVPINELKQCEYNPRKWDEAATKQLKESLTRYGQVDPIIVNSAPERMNVILGGNFRTHVAKQLGYTELAVVYINVPDIEKEKEIVIRLNKNTGEFDMQLLSEFGESFLGDIGFSSEDLDDIFPVEETPEVFDLEKELEKLDIQTIDVKTGDMYDLNGSRLLCGDSMEEADILKLMGGEKADMCMTDQPYFISYLKGKRAETKEGFGLKRNRRYIGTDELPDDFVERWMANVAKVQKPDFAIIAYENWANIPLMWSEMQKYWRVKNMLVWRLPNRTQGFAAKYKFFSKYDIALVGGSGDVAYNTEDEEGAMQEEYETALFAISGRPQWESYEKNKRYCPTDFIDYKADDQKSSGQGIVFGTKPVPILIPYIKVLTKRGDLVIEPFSGSGSTLIACTKLGRRCYGMEKQPIYAEVIMKRWENLTGLKRQKIND